ncbi:MAG TPA: class I tRNA ligase family protein, partial [Candidatus Brocadiia bacterium]|nr:class I tRNA ligase family protein [Candidatus Brocadiia bacterium]
STNIRRDPDVLDTWFSSALWPFSTLGWPDKTPELDFYYPTSTLVTDRGIIFFWVARMVMMGLAMRNEVPFRDVYIHGTILDEEGRKMSKSLGNGIDPLIMIGGGTQEYLGQSYECDGYGADAVRYSLVMLSTEGQDLKLSPTRFEMGRNFANKVWNAARFVLLNLAETPPGATMGPIEALEDQWILSRLAATAAAVTQSLEEFHFNDAGRQIYDFIWREFCDWYVEISKPRLRLAKPGDPVRHVLAHVLDSLLRMLHPFQPFLTEAVWQRLKVVAEKNGLRWPGSQWPAALMLAPWPKPDAALAAPQAETAMNLIQDLTRAVRNIRVKMNVPERKPLNVIVSLADAAAVSCLQNNARLLRSLACVEEVTVGVNLPQPEKSATEVMAQAQLFVPLSGLIDVAEERERLCQAIAKLEKYRGAILKKLDNPGFVSRAPANVVQAERDKLAETENQIAALNKSLFDLA